jgi:hypothetical protein
VIHFKILPLPSETLGERMENFTIAGALFDTIRITFFFIITQTQSTERKILHLEFMNF